VPNERTNERANERHGPRRALKWASRSAPAAPRRRLYNIRGQPFRDLSPSSLRRFSKFRREISGPRRAGINGSVSGSRSLLGVPRSRPLPPPSPSRSPPRSLLPLFARIARVETRFEIRRRRPGRRDPPTGFALLFALRNDCRRVPGTQKAGVGSQWQSALHSSIPFVSRSCTQCGDSRA